jgi:hypothetical protein
MISPYPSYLVHPKSHTHPTPLIDNLKNKQSMTLILKQDTKAQKRTRGEKLDTKGKSHLEGNMTL